MKTIYIIGDFPMSLTENSVNQFSKLESILKVIGFEVINPIKNFLNSELSTLEIYNENILKLISCDAVYVMSNVSLKNNLNIEYQISIELNKTIVLDTLFVNELR